MINLNSSHLLSPVGTSASSLREVRRRSIWAVPRTQGCVCELQISSKFCGVGCVMESVFVQELEEVGGLEELEKEISRRIRLSKNL